MSENIPHRFDRVPETAADRTVPERPTRTDILDWWQTRFGVESKTFDRYTFWEKGSGKIWAFSGTLPDRIEIEALGLKFLRTRQEHWKPTTNAVQRFGSQASKNVITVEPEQAREFVRGNSQRIEWDGEWGYLIVNREYVDGTAPLGVGLYIRGELRSMVPKGRRISPIGVD